MKIKVLETWNKILHSDIIDRINRDDTSISYQELYLYVLIRGLSTTASPTDEIDPDNIYKEYSGIKFIDETWNNLRASKYNNKTFNKPWDKVF